MKLIFDIKGTISQEAVDLFNNSKNSKYTAEELKEFAGEDLVNIADKLGQNFFEGGNGSYDIAEIPDIYEPYVDIWNHDGHERIVYKTEQLLADKLRDVDIEELGSYNCQQLLKELKGAIIPKGNVTNKQFYIL